MARKSSSSRRKSSRKKSRLGILQLFLQKWFWITILILGAGIKLFDASWLDLGAKFETEPLDELVIKGKPFFTRAEDIQTVLEKMGGLKGYFTQDMDKLAQEVSTIPWIKRFVIHKTYPNKVTFWVVDYIPIATLNDFSFISEEGVVFSLPQNRVITKDLPKLYGDKAQAKLLYKTWQQMSNILQKYDMSLNSLSLNPQGSLELVLDDDLLLKLGRSDWKEKLTNFAIAYPTLKKSNSKKINYIDLRYKTGMAVKYSE